jgi:hypothetical protein
MKALIISMLILLIVIFGLVPVLGQAADSNSPQPTEQEKKPVIKELEHKKAADVNVIADPNAVRAKIKEFEGLGEALAEINMAGENEIREWTRGRLDDRFNLVLAAQKQNIAELKFLRELAVKEKAVQTTAAIDGVLLARQERFKGLIKELESKSERFRRLNERMERRKEREQSNRERTGRSRKDAQP